MYLVVEFLIPGDAVPWKSPQVVQRGKFRMAYSPKRMAEQKKEIQRLATQAMMGRPPSTESVRIYIKIFKKVPKSYSKKKRAMCLENPHLCPATPDVTNVVKLTEDGMKEIVFYDDKQVVSQRNDRFWSEEAGVNVVVESLAAQ
jgi:Holliday junction resolvase RusA-like endonuclease